MNDYLKQVEAAIRATAIHSPTTYSWFGKRSPLLPLATRRKLTAETARSYLLFALQAQLYSDFYCRGFAAPARKGFIPLAAAGPTPFVEALSAANSGMGYWQDGWRAHAVSDDEVVVNKDGLEIYARLEECFVPQDVPIVPGIQLSLHFPKDSPSISPGFYMALSDKELTWDDSQSLVRIYWNLTAEGAVRLMRQATSPLNRAHLPFSLKVLNDPDRFTRCDAGVLYMRKSDYEAISEILGRIYPALVTGLKHGTPVFTKPLAVGVGLAEDPGQGDSFGRHRCRLLADGMIRAYEQGKKSLDDRLQVVVDHFAEAGISLERPFLNPGSRDDYDFHPRLQTHQLSQSTPIAPHADSSEGAFLRTAHEIGQRLAQEAVWYQDRCSWLGAEPNIDASTQGVLPTTYRALGPNLYSGTSGVALFLAELFATTGDSAARRTALGAIRQALLRIDAVPLLHRLGLYSGWIGIAFAAVRVGAVLGEVELVERAAQLLQRCVRESWDVCEFDLLSGQAGAVATLVVLRDVLNDESLLDFAVRLGDDLLKSADKSDAGYSWKSPAFPKQRPLTGFSHGTAGVGYALLELFSVTGDSKYRKGAEMAFNYERHWFNADASNWLDLREVPLRRKLSKTTLSFMTAWCHGAPGIGLSRLRAYQILKDEEYKAEAVTALGTTHRMIEGVLHHGIGDFSLCHGLAGNAQVLLHGCHVLGQVRTNEAAAALNVANAGIETYASRGLAWPCGTGVGETPGLMLGLAGIGYFYLRLHDPATPSLLMMQREEFLPRERSRNSSSQQPPDDRSITSLTTLYDGVLNDDHHSAVVRAALRAHGFTVSEADLSRAIEVRWQLGCWLRDRALPDRFPEFADTIDYLTIAEVDPYLWKSLPYMLAFGYQQAEVLRSLVKVPAEMRSSAAILSAAFSALLSLFDYLVDETSEKMLVFEVERVALPGMFESANGIQEALAHTYERVADLRLRLLCTLFAILEAGLRELYKHSGNNVAWADLAKVMSRLFEAERKITLVTATSREEMRVLLPDSKAKSVLPFVTLLQILILAGPCPEAPSSAREASTMLGRIVSLADDLVDLPEDYRRGVPSPVVLRLTDMLAERGCTQVSDADIHDLVDTVVAELLKLLQPSAFGLESTGNLGDPQNHSVSTEGEAAKADLAELLDFTRLTVARWVGWQEDNVSVLSRERIGQRT